MNEDLPLNRIKFVWCRRPDGLLYFPFMMVLNVFPRHLADSVKQLLRNCGTKLVMIPGEITSLLKSLYISLNNKAAVRHSYVKCICSGEPAVTPNGQLKWASAAALYK